MRRIYTIFSLLILFGFTGCEKIKEDSNMPSELRGSKEHVSDFMQSFGEVKGEGLLSGVKFSEDNCYNITPKTIADLVDAKIFKFKDSCASFLLYENQIYPIGEFFGGYGIVDMELCDFDGDMQYDLLYTYSFGSGLHRSLVGHFNLDTKVETTLDFTYSNYDMLLEKIKDNEFFLYHADVDLIDDSFTNLKLTKGAYLASIIYENNEISVVEQQK